MPQRIHFVYFDIDTGFYPGAHHGLAALFAAVRQAGHECSLTHITADMTPEQFVEKILDADTNADVYGFSAMTNQFAFVRKFAAPLADASGLPIIVGGVHAALMPREACSVPGVTCACRGEGDIFIQQWLDAGERWDQVPGVWYQRDGTVHSVPGDAPRDLDALANPDYEPFDMERIVRDLGGRLSLIVSRGCPFTCTYCCNEAFRAMFPHPGKYVRIRSPRGAVALVEQAAGQFAARSIRFEDDLLLVHKRWRREFFDLYRKRVGLPFECNSRVDTVTGELVDLLKESGCISLDIGVESGDERFRNEILGKNISDAQIERAFALLNDAGVNTYVYNIIGLPTETCEMARQTYLLNRRIKPSAGTVFYFYPFPGTKLAKLAEDKGLLRDDFETARGFTRRPSVTEAHVSHRRLRRIFRRLRMYLLLRRFKTFFPLPRAVKVPMAWFAWGAFLVCPGLIELFLTDSRLKRWLRKQAFRT